MMALQLVLALLRPGRDLLLLATVAGGGLKGEMSAKVGCAQESRYSKCEMF